MKRKVDVDWMIIGLVIIIGLALPFLAFVM